MKKKKRGCLVFYIEITEKAEKEGMTNGIFKGE